MSEKPYATVRDILGNLIGQRLCEVTQHDEDEYARTKSPYVILHFETGGIKIVLDNFDISELDYDELLDD